MDDLWHRAHRKQEEARLLAAGVWALRAHHSGATEGDVFRVYPAVPDGGPVMKLYTQEELDVARAEEREAWMQAVVVLVGYETASALRDDVDRARSGARGA